MNTGSKKHVIHGIAPPSRSMIFSPLLQRDPDKCILCGRCVRICDEVQGVGELSFAKRGIKTLIDTDFHRPLNCEFCGQCLDTCPVGAITSDCFDYATKAWEWTETTTPCPYCACGCLLTIGSKEGEVKRVFSDPEQARVTGISVSKVALDGTSSTTPSGFFLHSYESTVRSEKPRGMKRSASSPNNWKRSRRDTGRTPLRALPPAG